ncbi:MAG TPA: hypothetical protein VND88_00790 [Candidatus Acidoferrales bacterium]|nr:hypothetical protein [Candidatus Acidoferrales bacterium]
MVINVCCPTCWKWSELGTAYGCKRCGTPLIMSDGRRADEVAALPPPVDVVAPPEPPPVEHAPVGWSVRVRE